MASNFDSGFETTLSSRALRLEEHDLKQRSMGCLGFSAIAHITFLVALMISGLFAKTWHQERSRQANKQAQGAKKTGAKSPARTLANKVANGEVNHEIIFAETTHAKIIAPANKDDKAPSPEQPIVAPKTVIASAPHPEPTLTNPIKPVPKLTQLPKKNAKEKHGKSSLKVAQKTESAPAKKTAEPEMLSPIIAADPLPGEHTLVAAGPSSDELEAQAAAEAAGSGAGTATTANDDTAFSVVDASARQPLAGNPLPTYPQEDRLSGYQGTTVLRGHVTADGQMSDVKIEKSSGSPSLDRASLDAFKNWRFAPGEDAEVRKAITFSLNGETQVVPARLGSR